MMVGMHFFALKWPYQCYLPVLDDLCSDLSYLILADV